MTTTTVYADAADGEIYSFSDSWDNEGAVDGVYADARAGTGAPGLSANTAGAAPSVGQYRATSIGFDYAVSETFLGFDTASIDDGDTVSAAVLNVTSYGDYSTTDFTIQARLRDWGATLTTADWVAGADLSGLTLLATYATSSGFTANSAYDFSDSAMPANVSKTGVTRMLLCSSRTVGNNAPTGAEYVEIKSADTTGTTSDPKLTVTHAASGGTTVTPGTLSLTTTSYAPTVTATANQLVTPGKVDLALTAYVPTVTASDHQLVTPGTAALTLTPYTPGVTAGAGLTLVPGTAALTLTPYTPGVTTTAHQTVIPGPLGLTLTAFAPDVVATSPVVVTPGTASILLTTYAPFVGSQLLAGGRSPSGRASAGVPSARASTTMPAGG